MTLAVNTAQLLNELETLAAFSDAPAPAVTRVVFSEVCFFEWAIREFPQVFLKYFSRGLT